MGTKWYATRIPITPAIPNIQNGTVQMSRMLNQRPRILVKIYTISSIPHLYFSGIFIFNYAFGLNFKPKFFQNLNSSFGLKFKPSFSGGWTKI